MSETEVHKQEAKDVVGTEQEQPPDSSLTTVEEKVQTLDNLRERVLELTNLIDHSYWQLAKNLYQINDTKSYQAWGFSTFDEYIEKDLQFGIRKGRHLVDIYKRWHTQPQELQDRVKEIGWSKAKELSGLESNEKIIPLIENAETMSRREFNEHVKKFKAELAGAQQVNTELLQTVSFKIPAVERKNVEEAIKIAQEISDGSRNKAFALICREFVASYAAQKDKKLDESDYLRNFEKYLNMQLVGIREDEFVYGEETVNKIIEAVKEEKDD